MPKSKSRKKKAPKRVLALPDLEHAKTAVLNSLTSASGQRTYEHASREFVTPVNPEMTSGHGISGRRQAGDDRRRGGDRCGTADSSSLGVCSGLICGGAALRLRQWTVRQP